MLSCKKKNNEYFVVKGSGKPLRQFIYSDDLARLILWILQEYNDRETIILSVGEEDEVSIRDVAMMIAESYDYSEKVVFDTSAADGQFKKTADNSKLKNIYKNLTFIDIKEGIKKSVQWFIDNYKTCRK